MNPAEVHARASALFAELIEAKPDDRARRLEALARAEPDVHAALERLLRAHTDPPDAGAARLLDKPALGTAFDAAAGLDTLGATAEAEDPFIGRRVGPFEVRRLIARGGMSAVYEARQASPTRAVALKVMGRSLASEQAARRFEHETEFLGRLRHPGIAQIYAAGVHSDDGWRAPYFAMELVHDALPITEFARRSGLGRRERLALFAQACDAVQAGHQMGVIHRDLKPANILVDGDGRVKVIDFGVARSTDADVAATQLTETGQIVGTLQYMSPEQLDGDPNAIDTRSDVYALGMVLHELLLGSPPYDLSGLPFAAALRKVQGGSPASESRRRQAGRDLDAVLGKALDPRRDRRYDTAEALEADVRAVLEGRAISARPPTRWERAVRKAARRPIPFTAAACIVIAGATLLGSLLTHGLIMRRPARVEMQTAAFEARLLSAAGVQVKSWNRSNTGLVADARVIEAEKTAGMGDLLVLAIAAPVAAQGPSREEGYVVVSRLESYDTPLWRVRGRSPDLEARAHPQFARDTDVYVPRTVLVADVFPDSPGHEILLTFRQGRHSRCCVRAYSPSGAVLAEWWHDGYLTQPYWLTGPGLLIFAGVNSWGEWPSRGIDEAAAWANAAPTVVFAIRPAMDPTPRWIAGAGPGPALAPEWMRCVLPPKEGSRLRPNGHYFGAVVAAHGEDPRWRFALDLENDTPEFRSNLTGVMDSTGELVRWSPDDSYRAAVSQQAAPDWRQLSIGDLPPIVRPELVAAGHGPGGSSPADAGAPAPD